TATASPTQNQSSSPTPQLSPTPTATRSATRTVTPTMTTSPTASPVPAPPACPGPTANFRDGVFSPELYGAPMGLAADASRLYVSDIFYKRIRILDRSSGALLAQAG